jgi:hypothetical protein
MFLFSEPHKSFNTLGGHEVVQEIVHELKPTFVFGPKTHWIDNDVKLENLGLARTSTQNQCKKLAHKIQSKNLEPTRPSSSSS